jgi:methionine sulfoxide reductase heme-binding subunit
MTVSTATTKRLRRRLCTHHLPLAVGTVFSFVVLFVTRPYPDWISRASFATAYPALFLLLATLCLGPLNLLRKKRNPSSSDLRRDVGIWAGTVGAMHAVIGQCVHLRGRPWLYYVYEHRLGHVLPFRHDLFGFANFSGLLAALVLLALLATSNDLCLKSFGTPRWKQLQRWNYLCFGLAAVHTILYQITEGKINSFVALGGISMLLTLALQLSGYMLRRQRRTQSQAVEHKEV